MSSRRHRAAEAEQRIERLIATTQRYGRSSGYRRRSRQGAMHKWVRAGLLGMLFTFVLVPGAALGAWLLLGIKLLQVLLAAPLFLAASWIGIVYFTLTYKPAPPKLVADSSV